MKLIINGELPSLNEYIRAERSNRYAASKIKKDATELVYWSCREQKLSCCTKPVKITFHWYMKNKRKDLDNVAFAKKFVNDGLVKAGILFDDSQKWVVGFEDKFSIDSKNPRTEIDLKNIR